MITSITKLRIITLVTPNTKSSRTNQKDATKNVGNERSLTDKMQELEHLLQHKKMNIKQFCKNDGTLAMMGV